MNLRFSFFSTPIWLEWIVICFIHTHNTLNSAIIVIFAKKRRGSDFVFVSLLTALEFCLYSLAIMKILIFSEIYKLQSLFFNLYYAISYARFWALSYILLIFISHAKIRVFSVCANIPGEILLPPTFFKKNFSARVGRVGFLADEART